MDSEIGSETGGMIVKRVSVPVGLEELMEGLVKEVLITKPDDIYIFAAKYFSQLLKRREKTERGQHKVKTMRSAQSFKDQGEKRYHTKIPVQAATKQLSRQFSIRGESPNQDLNIVSQKPRMYNRNELKYKRRNTGPQTILENQSLVARKQFSKSVSTDRSRDDARNNARKEPKKIDSPRDTIKDRKEDMTKTITGIIPGISKDKKEVGKAVKNQKDVIKTSASISSDETNEDQSSAKTNDSSGDVVSREEDPTVGTQSLGVKENQMNKPETVENNEGNVAAGSDAINNIKVLKDMRENIKTVPNSEDSKAISMDIETSIQAKNQHTNAGAEDIERTSSKDEPHISNKHSHVENIKNRKNDAKSKLNTEQVEQMNEDLVSNEEAKQPSENIETNNEFDQSSISSKHFQGVITKDCDSNTMNITSQEVPNVEDKKRDVTMSVKTDEKTQSAMNIGDGNPQKEVKTSVAELKIEQEVIEDKIETGIEKEKITDKSGTAGKDDTIKKDKHSNLIFLEKMNDPDGLRSDETKEDLKSNRTTKSVGVGDRENEISDITIKKNSGENEMDSKIMKDTGHKLKDDVNETSSNQSHITSENNTKTDNEMIMSNSDNNEAEDEMNKSKIPADESKNDIGDQKQLVNDEVPKLPSSKDTPVKTPLVENKLDESDQLESAALEKNDTITTVTDKNQSSDQENQAPRDTAANVVKKIGSETLVEKIDRPIAMSESKDLRKDNQENISIIPRRGSEPPLSNSSEMKNKGELSVQSSFPEASLKTREESEGSEENNEINPDDMSKNQDSLSNVNAKDNDVVEYIRTGSEINEKATAIQNDDKDETKNKSAAVEGMESKKVAIDKRMKKSKESNERDIPEDEKPIAGIKGNGELTDYYQKSDENILVTAEHNSQSRNDSKDTENRKPNRLELKNNNFSEVYVKDEMIGNSDRNDMRVNLSEDKDINKITDKSAETDVANGISKKQVTHKGRSATEEEITDDDVAISKHRIKSVESNEEDITGDERTILKDIEGNNDVTDCQKNDETVLVTTKHNSKYLENSGPMIQDCTSIDESKDTKDKKSNINNKPHLKNDISSGVRNNGYDTEVNLSEHEGINNTTTRIKEKSIDHVSDSTLKKQEVHGSESAAAERINDDHHIDEQKNEESVVSKAKEISEPTLHDIKQNNDLTDCQKAKENVLVTPKQNSKTLEISGSINDRDCTSIDESKDIKSQTANTKAGSDEDSKNDSSSKFSTESYVKDNLIPNTDENDKEANLLRDNGKETSTMSVQDISAELGGASGKHKIRNPTNEDEKEECFTSNKNEESENKQEKSGNIQETSISTAQQSKVAKVKEDGDKSKINEESMTPDDTKANYSNDENEQESIKLEETENIETPTTISSSTNNKSINVPNKNEIQKSLTTGNVQRISSSTGNHTAKKSADSDYSSGTSIENSTKETSENTDDNYKTQLTTDGELTKNDKPSSLQVQSKEVVIGNSPKNYGIEDAVKTVHKIQSDMNIRVSSVDEEPFKKKIVTTLGEEEPNIDNNNVNKSNFTESIINSKSSTEKEVESRKNVHEDDIGSHIDQNGTSSVETDTKSFNKELSLIDITKKMIQEEQSASGCFIQPNVQPENSKIVDRVAKNYVNYVIDKEKNAAPADENYYDTMGDGSIENGGKTIITNSHENDSTEIQRITDEVDKYPSDRTGQLNNEVGQDHPGTENSQAKSSFDGSQLHEELRKAEEESKLTTFKQSYNPFHLRKEIENASSKETSSSNNNERKVNHSFAEAGAALKIQSNWRGFTVRRKMGERIIKGAEQQDENSNVLKGSHVVRSDHKSTEDIIRAVVTLQSLWRGYKTRMNLKGMHVRSKRHCYIHAAIKIQKLWRGFKARKDLKMQKLQHMDVVSCNKVEDKTVEASVPHPISKNSTDSDSTVINEEPLKHSHIHDSFDSDTKEHTEMNSLLDEILDYPVMEEHHLIDTYQNKLLDKISGKNNDLNEDIEVYKTLTSKSLRDSRSEGDISFGSTEAVLSPKPHMTKPTLESLAEEPTDESESSKLYTFCSVPSPITKEGKPISNLVEMIDPTKRNAVRKPLQHSTSDSQFTVEVKNVKSPVRTMSSDTNTGYVKLLHTGEFHDSLVLPLPKDISEHLKPNGGPSTAQVRSEEDKTDTITNVGLLHTGELHDSIVLPLPKMEKIDLGDGKVEDEASPGHPAAQTVVSVNFGNDAATTGVQVLQAPASSAAVTSARAGGDVGGAAQTRVPCASAGDGRKTLSATRPPSMGSEESVGAAQQDISMESEAARKIQAGFRGYQVRKQLKLKNGSSDMSNSRRQMKPKSSSQPKAKELEEKSAVKIQAGVRGFLVRRRQKKQINQ